MKKISGIRMKQKGKSEVRMTTKRKRTKERIKQRGE